MCLEQIKRIINMIRSICFAIEHFVDFISILYGDLKKEKKLTPSLTLSLFFRVVRSTTEVFGVTDRSAGTSQFQ